MVAAPGDRLSRSASAGLVLLIVANAAAQLVGAWWPHPDLALPLRWLEWVSMGLFAVEYLARLWAGHADGANSEGATRLGRVVHPLMLIDLLVLLAFFCQPWLFLDLRFLRLTRVPDLLFRITRTLSAAAIADGQAPFAEVLSRSTLRLAAVRSDLSEAARVDLTDLRERLIVTTDEVRRIQNRWLAAARRRPSDAHETAPATRDEIDGLLARLQDELTSPERLDLARQASQAAYERSAALFADLPETAVDVRDLQWRGRCSCREVPLRRIGDHHFRDLEGQWQGADTRFATAYGGGLADGVAGIRAATRYLFEQAEERGEEALNAQLQGGLRRSVNRCRDLDEAASGAWETQQWDLEVKHVDRMQLVEVDVSRYGRVEFYLARAGRGLLHGSRIALWRARSFGLDLIPGLLAQAREAHRRVFELLRPGLEWLGVVHATIEEIRQEAEEARLDSVLQGQLPDDYLTHFRFEPLDDESLMVGFDAELGTIERAIHRWEEGSMSSFLLHGPRGGGKTSMLNVAQRRLFEDDARVTHAVVQDKITEPAALTAFLRGVLGFGDEVQDVERLAGQLLDGPKRALLLEGCHNLYLRRIGSLGALRQLLWLVARTNHHVLWGLCVDEQARRFLGKWLPFDRLFHFDIGIQPWSPEELRRLILQRHHLSGYRLRYATGPQVEGALRRRVRNYRHVEEPAAQEALATLFFEGLAETCRENTLAAMFYWLRSLEPSSRAEEHTVQPMAPLELSLVRELSTESAFALAAVLQHDNLTAPQLATVIDTDRIDALMELDILWNLNFLEHDTSSGQYRINPVALKPVCAMLEGRNLLY